MEVAKDNSPRVEVISKSVVGSKSTKSVVSSSNRVESFSSVVVVSSNPIPYLFQKKSILAIGQKFPQNEVCTMQMQLESDFFLVF